MSLPEPDNAAPDLHPPETAGHHLVPAPLVGGIDEAVGGVLARLPEAEVGSIDTLYVVDADGRLAGTVPLVRLFGARPEQPLRALMRPQLLAVRPEEDQERMALFAIAHGLSAVPVVDPAGRLQGIVPAHVLMGILHREHVEDLHRLVGITRHSNEAVSAIEGSRLHRVRARLPWLLVGLAGSIAATGLVAYFEAVLSAKLAFAFFIPAIVYLADAVGTQTEAIVVRGLSLSRAPFGRLLFAEFAVGLLLGLLLSALAMPIIQLAFGDWRLTAAVGAAIVASATVATSIGLALPWSLSRFGLDPALGSGPLATIIQDVLSLAIYFGLAALLVPD